MAMKLKLFIYSGWLSCTLALALECSAQMVDGSSATHLTTAPAVAPFVREQLRFSRVRQARAASEASIQQLFRQRRISYPAAEVFVRVFKRERELELWVRPASSNRFELLRTYPICALAGVLGPKRVQGDGQVPEGFYSIDLFNPASSYHLSLRIDYPNQRDQRSATQTHPLGGDIFIHGGCKSDGCLAITDEAIQELYWIAVTARGEGQENIPVHIFPTRFDDEASIRKLERAYHGDRAVLEFWESLRPGYDFFQKTHQLPVISVDSRGRYRTD
jgi:murein L,D-transpeptidase YafK